MARASKRISAYLTNRFAKAFASGQKRKPVLNPNEAKKGYIAVKSKKHSGCHKCAFRCATIAETEASPDCACTPCTADERQDGCEVYFVKKPKIETLVDNEAKGFKSVSLPVRKRWRWLSVDCSGAILWAKKPEREERGKNSIWFLPYGHEGVDFVELDNPDGGILWKKNFALYKIEHV